MTYCVPVAASSTPYRLPWRRQQRPKALLRHVSFTAQPGRLLYIMGGSGAGKSTLLDLLSHRARADGGVGWQSGELCYNGMEQRRAWRHVEPHVAYVRQVKADLCMRGLIDLGDCRMDRRCRLVEGKGRVVER